MLIYGLLWLSFGMVHSFLALPTVKRRIDKALGGYFGIFFTLVTLAQLAGIFAYEQLVMRPLARQLPIPGEMIPFSYLLLLIALVMMAWPILQFGILEFVGLKRSKIDPADLRASGIFRFVRQPVNAGFLFLFWGKVRTDVDLVAAVFVTAYIIVGTVHNERKMLDEHGDAYRDYMLDTPAFIPWKLPARKA